MSDDEDYYDEYFDDDFLWLDDGDAMLDETIIGTTHSPVYLDDQCLYDALDSDSDWEYYTDEYYDDDPSVIRRTRPRKKNNVANAGKDKTLDGKHQIKPSIILPMARVDTDNFQGTLWKTPEFYATKLNPFKPGDGEAVTLLKNWREIFEQSKPKTNRKSFGDFRSREPQTKRETVRPTKRAHEAEIKASGAEFDSLALWEAVEDLTGHELNAYGEDETESPPIASSPLPLPPLHLDAQETKKGAGQKGTRVKPSPNALRPNGSRLKEVTTAEDFSLLDEHPTESTAPSTHEIKVMVPPTPDNSQNYKKLAEIPVNSGGANRRGRKRKASSSFEQANGGQRGRPAKKPAPNPSAVEDRKPEKKKPANERPVSSQPRAPRNSGSTRSLRKRL